MMVCGLDGPWPLSSEQSSGKPGSFRFLLPLFSRSHRHEFSSREGNAWKCACPVFSDKEQVTNTTSSTLCWELSSTVAPHARKTRKCAVWLGSSKSSNNSSVKGNEIVCYGKMEERFWWVFSNLHLNKNYFLICHLKVKFPAFLGFCELSWVKSTCVYHLQFIY